MSPLHLKLVDSLKRLLPRASRVQKYKPFYIGSSERIALKWLMFLPGLPSEIYVARYEEVHQACRLSALRGFGLAGVLRKDKFRLLDAGPMIMQGLAFGGTRVCRLGAHLDPFFPDSVRAW